jgi:hypothetical protein
MMEATQNEDEKYQFFSGRLLDKWADRRKKKIIFNYFRSLFS